MDKPPSFVGNYENGDRGIDISRTQSPPMQPASTVMDGRIVGYSDAYDNVGPYRARSYLPLLPSMPDTTGS
jgi:hypothetical protein